MTNRFDYPKLVNDLSLLLKSLPSYPPPPANANSRLLNKLRQDLKTAIKKLQALAESLDPIKQPPDFFDPSDPRNVGEMVAGALVLQPRHSLGTVEKFYGSGVYALYYRGDFDAYKPISKKDHPIYVGKADPQDGHAKTPEEQGTRLSVRLSDHLKSVSLAENLRAEDFDCRYLVVTSGWQKSAEEHLIHRYKPVWNSEMKICFGFGKHGDDAKTRSNKRSPWDMLHPGRQWAIGNAPNERGVDQIKVDIAAHLKNTIFNK
ncbi:MAG: Eco29kI family restriction endonuclease [Elusimicrobia bacterium]|nr:Eco29kI family restriction endonuclease [Elusimicrobiota bacterium]